MRTRGTLILFTLGIIVGLVIALIMKVLDCYFGCPTGTFFAIGFAIGCLFDWKVYPFIIKKLRKFLIK